MIPPIVVIHRFIDQAFRNVIWFYRGSFESSAYWTAATFNRTSFPAPRSASRGGFSRFDTHRCPIDRELDVDVSACCIGIGTALMGSAHELHGVVGRQMRRMQVQRHTQREAAMASRAESDPRGDARA